MGRITVRDLAETAARSLDIIVADRDRAAARRLASELPRRVRAIEADAASPASLARALKGATVVVNACHHDFNLRVMDAALKAGSHYLDLGGLFHVTRRQLARDAQFRRAGLLAVCGMGSAPGIVNVMARVAAGGLDRVHEIHIAVGTRDATRRRGRSLLDTSYSIQTVLDEASQPAALFTRGALWFVEPLSRAEAVRFPAAAIVPKQRRSRNQLQDCVSRRPGRSAPLRPRIGVDVEGSNHRQRADTRPARRAPGTARGRAAARGGRSAR
jgi:saccharopine dehydrogenase-like NADP-dependent oxidoreductase